MSSISDTDDLDQVSVHSCNSELSSGSKSVIDSIKLETERRKSRLMNIKSKNPKTKHRNRTKLSASTKVSSSPNNLKSIMVVRTLKESLDTSKELGSVRGRRRRLNRRMRERMKDVQNSEVSKLDNTSSSFSSSSTSVVSFHKYDVSYDIVTIREYPMIPGDNPSVFKGPPLSIQWTHTNEVQLDVDQYEDGREGQRRTQSQMKVPTQIRTRILLSLGHKLSDIREASKNAAVHRRKRQRTLEMLHTYKMEERIERFTRAFKKPFKSFKARKHERNMSSYHSFSDHDNDSESSYSEILFEMEQSQKNFNADHHDKQTNEKDKSTSYLDTTKRIDNLSITNSEELNKDKQDDINLPVTEHDNIPKDNHNHQIDDIDSSKRRKYNFDLVPNSPSNEHTETVTTTTITTSSQRTSSSDSKSIGTTDSYENQVNNLTVLLSQEGKKVQFSFH